MIGAGIAAAAPGVPSWSTGFQDGSNLGGLIAAVLAPAGGFGKFLLVLMAVSISSTSALIIYSFGEYYSLFNMNYAVQEWFSPKRYPSKLFLINCFSFNHRFRHFIIVLSV